MMVILCLPMIKLIFSITSLFTIQKELRKWVMESITLWYNDGDPLSADDQTYILDNVFNHHPEKARKMGAGVDYIMVTKNIKFQEDRCFYVVLDGCKEELSYRECLENFVREKYPDKVDEFIPKYFKEPCPSPTRNRDRGSCSDEVAIPLFQSGWGLEFSNFSEEIFKSVYYSVISGNVTVYCTIGIIASNSSFLFADSMAIRDYM